VLFLSAISSLLFALKFLEWGFTRDWNELRTITVRQVAIDCSSYPQWNSAMKKQSPSKIEDIYRDNIMMLLRAFIQFITLRILMYVIPETWVSLSFWSFESLIWPIRYLLLSFILYLTIGVVTNIVFGVGGLIWGMPMNSTFPAFPFTSCSIREFWSRRWNVFIKQLLQRTSFIVLPRWLGMSQTMSNTVRGLMSFVLSGIFHELLFTMSTDQWSGKNMIFFLLHALFVTMEILWDRTRKTAQPKGTYFGWLRTIGVVVLTSPLFFDPWIDAGYFVSLKKYLT
jgi:hypothetical protein